MSGSQAQVWFDKFNEAARQDPRKTGALGVLVLVLAVMGGRMLLTGDVQPARASARVFERVADLRSRGVQCWNHPKAQGGDDGRAFADFRAIAK